MYQVAKVTGQVATAHLLRRQLLIQRSVQVGGHVTHKVGGDHFVDNPLHLSQLAAQVPVMTTRRCDVTDDGG